MQLLSEQIALEAAPRPDCRLTWNMTSDMSQVFLEIAQSGRWPLESESAVWSVQGPADAWKQEGAGGWRVLEPGRVLSRHLETLGGEAANVSEVVQACSASPALPPADAMGQG